MKKTVLATFAAVMMVGSTAYADGAQPSRDWSGNWGFPSASEKQILLNQADLIEFHENGGYNHNTTNNTYIGDTNIQCDSGEGEFSGGCATEIEQQNNSTAIGSQVVNDQSNNTNIVVQGSGNSVSTSQTNHTGGNTATTNGNTSAKSKIVNIDDINTGYGY